jgi:hypothetical protein
LGNPLTGVVAVCKVTGMTNTTTITPEAQATIDHFDRLRSTLKSTRKPTNEALARFRHMRDGDAARELAFDEDDDRRRGYLG